MSLSTEQQTQPILAPQTVETRTQSLEQTETLQEINHRQGDCLRIPQVATSSSLAYLVVNCVIPGLGTVIASWTDVEYRKWDWAVFITGILQFGLAWIIIGWAWSIWWGIRMYTEAQQRKARMEERTRRVEVVTRQNTIDSTANNPTSVDKPEQQYSVEVRTEPVRTAEEGQNGGEDASC